MNGYYYSKMNRTNQDDVVRDLQERYRQLSEPNELERRHWAAVEAMKIGWGGLSIVSRALRISPNTIKRGLEELRAGEIETEPTSRIRKPGGGRRSKQRVVNSTAGPAADLTDEVGGKVAQKTDSSCSVMAELTRQDSGMDSACDAGLS